MRKSYTYNYSNLEKRNEEKCLLKKLLFQRSIKNRVILIESNLSTIFIYPIKHNTKFYGSRENGHLYENIIEKGEKPGNRHFLHFLNVFYPSKDNFLFGGRPNIDGISTT